MNSRSNKEPETLGQMFGMIHAGPPMEDPVTVAGRVILRIYMDAKSKILLGDKQPESVAAVLADARERTIKEVAHVGLRNKAVKTYEEALARLEAGGEAQI